MVILFLSFGSPVEDILFSSCRTRNLSVMCGKRQGKTVLFLFLISAKEGTGLRGEVPNTLGFIYAQFFFFELECAEIGDVTRL